MASDLALGHPPVALPAGRIVEAAFVGFLLLAFVGINPFAPRVTEALTQGVSMGQGDALRQVLYIAVFSTIALGAFRKYGIGAIRLIPAVLALVLVWCLASSLWADEGGVTFRRAG